MLDLLGYHSDDVLSLPLYEFHHAADSDTMQKAYKCCELYGFIVYSYAYVPEYVITLGTVHCHRTRCTGDWYM